MPSHALRWVSVVSGLATLLFAAPCLAGKVYQWKDAEGVTHFTDEPPDGQEHQSRTFKDAPPPASAAPAGAEDPSCITARKNLEYLKSDKPVGLDANGDGKPDKEMSPAERAQQVQLAQDRLKASCTAPAPAQ